MRYPIRAASDYDLEKDLFGLDLETACNVEGCPGKSCDHALDQNRNKITMIAITNDADVSHVWRGPTGVVEFFNWLNANPTVVFTAHNGKFDFKQLINEAGESALNLIDRWVEDSILLAFSSSRKIDETYLANYESQRRELNKGRTGHKHREAGQHSLKTLAPYFLDVPGFWEPEEGFENDEYVLKDAVYALRLTKYFLANLERKTLSFYKNKQLPWTKNLLLMELNGITVDIEELNRQWRDTEVLLAQSTKDIKAQWKEYFDVWLDLQRMDVNDLYNARKNLKPMSAKQLARHEINKQKALANIQPLNLDSHQQLSWLLRDQLLLDITNLAGDESTDKETLQRLGEEHAEVARLLEYRKAKKLVSTYYPEYANTYIINDKIHAHFNPTGTRTGRLSCSSPNLQQCPGALHTIFVGGDRKVLITRDLAAIEPTLLAYYSEDPELCRIMIEESDFHGETAKAAFKLDCLATEVKKLYPKLRNIAKTIGLAVLYGAGKNQVYLVLKKNGMTEMTLQDAKNIVDSIREKYVGVWKFKAELDSALESEKNLYNLMGRPICIQDPEDVYMKGLNTLIQSSASDLLQEGALRINNELELNPLLLVHDEVIVEAPEEEADMCNENITQLLANIVKLDTKFGVIPVRTEGKVSKQWLK